MEETMQYTDVAAENDIIFLRPIGENDTDDVVRWRNTESVRNKFIYRQLFTRETHEKWLRTKVATGEVAQMIIVRKADFKPVGSVYVRDIDMLHHKGEYGIFIGEENARGQGIGTAAAELMITYAFRKLGLHRLYLRAFADNVQAIRSYEKAGFEKEAYLRDDVCIDGQYRDIVLMAIINPV